MSDGGGGGKKRRQIEEEHEEHENHERWLVSYADMMTLLMVLFIVMFAISQVDSRKFAALKTGLAAGFGAPVAFLNGGDAMLSSGGAVAPDSINLAGNAGNDTSKSFTPNTSTATEEQVAKLAKATEQAQVKKEVENLQKAEQQLKEALQKAGMSKKAQFRFNERGLVVTVATDNVLFPSGSADLQPQGQAVLNALGPTLKKLPNNLSIEGHTDSHPIHTALFASNWELSGGRASGVLRFLHTQDGIPFSRMSATGYADTEPRAKGSSSAADDKNRRVEIVVLARVDNSAGRAVAQLGNDDSSTDSATKESSSSKSESTSKSADSSGH